MSRSTLYIVTIGTVILLAGMLIAGGLWGISKEKVRNENYLKLLNADIDRIENRLLEESAKTQDSSFIYTDVETARQKLSEATAEVRSIKQAMVNEPDKVLTEIEDYRARTKKLNDKLDEVISERNSATGNFVLEARKKLADYEVQLKKANKQIKSLSWSLAQKIKEFKGTAAELEALKAEKARLDEIVIGDSVNMEKIGEITADRDELRDLLAKSQQTISDLNTEIARLSVGLDMLQFFDVTYELRSRQVSLNAEGNEPTNSQASEIIMEIIAGEKVFEPGDPKVVYVTLYKDGKPSPRMSKQPITIVNNRAKQPFEFSPKLDKGDYFFRVTYKERQLMPDYKFTLRGSLF